MTRKEKNARKYWAIKWLEEDINKIFFFTAANKGNNKKENQNQKL